MTLSGLDESTRKAVLRYQQDELNNHLVYKKLSRSASAHNAEILNKISEDELEHYNFWKKVSGRDLRPQKRRIWFFYLVARIFGLTFGMRLLERGESEGIRNYKKLERAFPSVRQVIEDEERHETSLIDMLDEDFLNYVGSIVLGLSDALVELTGALAGFTFALQNTGIIVVAGLVTGVSAALSMGASEYLSSSEEKEKSPLKAAIFTFITYLTVVIVLITPFLLLQALNPIIPLAISVVSAVLVILIFTFYISVAKETSFRRRFSKVAGISLGVAFISLVIGLLVRLVIPTGI